MDLFWSQVALRACLRVSLTGPDQRNMPVGIIVAVEDVELVKMGITVVPKPSV